MQLPDLKYDFALLEPDQQRVAFLEYYEIRAREMLMPPKRKIRKKATAKKKKKGKQITMTPEQIELLKKLKLL